MMIKIFDRDINFIGVLEKFNSFQCSIPFSNAGSFTIKAVMTEQSLELLEIGNIVVYNDFAGMIDSIQKTEEVGEASKINASGFNLTGLLDRRIIWNNAYYDTTAESFMRTVVDQNCITPSDSTRVIPHLVLGTASGLENTYKIQTENNNLLTALNECAEDVGYGFNVELDIENKEMVFNVFAQNDRTVLGGNQYILGKAYDNVIEEEYTLSTKTHTNTILVVSDDGTATYASGDAGYDRKEVYLKSNIKKENLTTEQFQDALRTEGKKKLIPVVNSFDIETAETDLQVGDVVSIVDREWGLNHSAMVSEKQITLQDGVETINYLFGNDIKEK